MGINVDQLKEYIIRPTLEDLGLWSQAAENLLLGTMAQESHMGHYIHQVKGPALGIYQIEPETHDDVWEHYLDYRESMADKVSELSYLTTSKSLVSNLSYATAIARIIYLRVSEPLPLPQDLVGMARYWKKYYNTPLGKGTEREFVRNYLKYVKGDI